MPVLYEKEHQESCCHAAEKGRPGHTGHPHTQSEYADGISCNVNEIHHKGGHHGHLGISHRTEQGSAGIVKADKGIG